TLITIEPGLLRLWTCCEAPNPNRPFQEFLVHQLSYSDVSSEVRASLESKAVQALHWINLVSGEFFRLHTERFNRNGRADHLLLDNLRYIRGELKEAGLDDDDICHDLLARIIFVQFLFDRKDSDGSAALNSIKLGRLHEEGVLSKIYTSFSEILE